MVVPPLAWPDGPEDSIRFCLVGDRPQLHQESIHPPVSTVDHGLGWAGNTPFSLTSPIRLSVCFIGREGGREGGTLLTVVPTSFRLPYRTPSLPSPRNTAQHNRSHRPLFPSPRLFNSIRTARPPGHRSNRMRRICIPKLVILLLLCTRTLPAGVSSAKIHGKNIWIRAQSICQCSN